MSPAEDLGPATQGGGAKLQAPISGARPLKLSLIPGIRNPASRNGLREGRLKSPLAGLLNSGRTLMPWGLAPVACQSLRD